MSITNPIIRLLPYLWTDSTTKYKIRLVVALAALICARVISTCIPITYKSIIDRLGIGTNTLVVIPVTLIILYGALRVTVTMLDDLRDTLFLQISQRTTRRVSLKVFEKLYDLGLSFHLDRRTGILSSSIERGTKAIATLLSRIVFMLAPSILEIVFVAVILWHLFGVLFAAIAVVTAGLYILFTILIVQWRTRYRKELNKASGDVNSLAVDSLLNYETVKYFNNEQYEASRYDQALSKYETTALRDQLSFTVLSFSQTAIITMGLVLMMLLASKSMVNKEMAIGDFVLVVTYMLQIYSPLNFFGMMYREVKQAISDMEYMFDLLSRENEINDQPNAQELDLSGGLVEFQNVRFGYDNERIILENLSLTIQAGKTVAVVGSSGAGKSTLSRLLMRFYEPDSGDIKIDGQSLRSLKQSSIRRAIGIIPQDTVLFNNSIGFNIAYGKPDASSAEIRDAAKIARIDDFIQTLPDGYDTNVGERGLKLSGGEKQRIAIARMALKNPSILIFDEATSALDSTTEKEIQRNLQEIIRGRTTLIIAHRLSTIVDADEIIVLGGGKVLERGRHHKLLSLGGIYSKMWHQQLSIKT